MKKDISANLYQKCLILCSKMLLNVLHNLSSTVLLPWQHTGFQTSPILKAFLATFGVSFSYLQMVPHTHDPTSIQICQLEFVALFNVFQAENHLYIELKGMGTRTECVAMGKKIFYSHRSGPQAGFCLGGFFFALNGPLMLTVSHKIKLTVIAEEFFS